MTLRDWDNIDTIYNENHEFIEAVMDIRYKDKYIGYYKLLYNINGETFDDYLVWE